MDSHDGNLCTSARVIHFFGILAVSLLGLLNDDVCLVQGMAQNTV